MFKQIATTLFLLLISVIAAIAGPNNENLGSIKGTVLSSDGQPVPFVTVSIPEAKMSVIADENGQFEFINITPGQYQIQVGAVGMDTKTTTVKAEAGKSSDLKLVMDQKSVELENVVVNARRTLNQTVVRIGKAGISPMDLPQSIAVVDATMMREQQVQRLSDAIRNVNGVSMAGQRASTQETFYARGYNMGSGNYFKNGSRINSGSFPEMSGLESVEVMKGSAAILFGNVAPGGIINMVSKKPKFNFGGEISLRAGSFGLIKPSFDVYGPISDKVAYRVNGTYESANSYRDNVESERFYVNPSFLFKLSKKSELTIEGDYLKHDFTPDFGIGSLDNTTITPTGRNTFYGTDWQYAKSKQASTNINYRYTFNSNWQLNTNASYQYYTRDYFSTERIAAKANGDWARPLVQTITEQNYGVITTDLTGQFKTGKIEHKLLVGLDADMYDDATTRFNNPAIYDTINLLNPEKFTARTDIPVTSKTYTTMAPTQRFGAYVQDLITLMPKLKMLVGVRWSTQSASVADTLYHTTGKEMQGVGPVKENSAFSPRLGLVFKPWNNTSLFASYSNSFVINSGIDIYGNPLDPSLVDQYEIGIKNDLLEGKLSLNVTAYRIINNNLSQTAPFLADGTPNNNATYKQLTGETTSDGVEVDFIAFPVQGLKITSGYAWNYMRYTNTPDVKGNYVEGERLVNAPEHTANLSAFYTFQKGTLNKLKLGIGAFYTGARVGGWNNTKDQAQNYDRRIPVEGFVTLDASAGYTFGHFSALLKVSNITNTFNYYVHENYSVNPIPPTQLVGTLAYKF